MRRHTAAERAANPAICPKHHIPHQLYQSPPEWGPIQYSMGCKLCVDQIKEDVQRMLENYRKFGRYGPRGKYRKCLPEDTGVLAVE